MDSRRKTLPCRLPTAGTCGCRARAGNGVHIVGDADGIVLAIKGGPHRDGQGQTIGRNNLLAQGEFVLIGLNVLNPGAARGILREDFERLRGPVAGQGIRSGAVMTEEFRVKTGVRQKKL
jgi:hypothetical protein